MIFTKKDLEEKLGMSKEERKLIMDFQKKIPLLNEDEEGFCIDARILHNQLGVKKAFSTWIKSNLDKAMTEQDIDYISKWIDSDGVSPQGSLENTSVTDLTGMGYKKEYFLTVEIAKEITMFTGANSQASDELKNNSKQARKYFILMEKAVRKMIEWKTIREPEKELYKDMCKELDKYFQRNLNIRPKYYDYANEADAINLVCLGAKAKDILNYFDAQDKLTREHLKIEYNTYLCKIQELNIMYLKMNLEKMRRYDLIKQGFKALYPFASFVMANKDKAV
jgi:phage anti-repressor protein